MPSNEIEAAVERIVCDVIATGSVAASAAVIRAELLAARAAVAAATAQRARELLLAEVETPAWIDNVRDFLRSLAEGEK